MRVFVTGATGHIGSALVPELLQAGHQVTGLARSDKSAAALAAMGAEAHRGDIADLDGLRAAASVADGVIHLAYRHDFDNDFVAAADADLRAVEAMGDVLAGSDRPLVNTSGTLFLPGVVQGRTATEHDTMPAGPRIDSENATIALAEKGVRSSVVRLSPLVHSDLDHHGFAHRLIGTAREKGVAAYIGDGSNRWPAVHTLDAARLYRLAVEAAPAGSRLHAAADEGVPFRSIAEAIGRGLNVPAKSIPAEKAGELFGGFVGMITQLDNLTSSARTRELLGWKPTHADLLADIADGHYFALS